jgi:hypothetical protein
MLQKVSFASSDIMPSVSATVCTVVGAIMKDTQATTLIEVVISAIS